MLQQHAAHQGQRRASRSPPPPTAPAPYCGWPRQRCCGSRRSAGIIAAPTPAGHGRQSASEPSATVRCAQRGDAKNSAAEQQQTFKADRQGRPSAPSRPSPMNRYQWIHSSSLPLPAQRDAEGRRGHMPIVASIATEYKPAKIAISVIHCRDIACTSMLELGHTSRMAICRIVERMSNSLLHSAKARYQRGSGALFTAG